MERLVQENETLERMHRDLPAGPVLGLYSSTAGCSCIPVLKSQAILSRKRSSREFGPNFPSLHSIMSVTKNVKPGTEGAGLGKEEKGILDKASPQ